jgi:hypothetical protein
MPRDSHGVVDEVVPEEGRCSFTGVPSALSWVDHNTALAEPCQNSIALLQR